MKGFYLNRITAECEDYLADRKRKTKDLDLVIRSLISIAIYDECINDTEFREIAKAADIERRAAKANKILQRLGKE